MPDITTANCDVATPELMKQISAAFNSRDVDRIASFFTEDATFWLARGPEPVGRTLKGRETMGSQGVHLRRQPGDLGVDRARQGRRRRGSQLPGL